jgi:hypothetical protein
MLPEYVNKLSNSSCKTKNVQHFILLEWSGRVSRLIDANAAPVAIDLGLCLKRKTISTGPKNSTNGKHGTYTNIL